MADPIKPYRSPQFGAGYSAETGVLPVNGKYLPMYRLRRTEGWNCVRRVECETAAEALRIANQIVQSIVSPAKLIEAEPEPLGNIDDWRRDKAQEAADERQRVFGAETSRTVRRPGRQPYEVVIERERKWRRA